ncbi:phytanoyl-CoA dioxygenase family protein [Aeoliella mucimassa]|uniref:1-deoxypentalenic acid 11-beta-hydroxylase n=1 Tax=Aeoliella mucimassa TaxID=2527972 RepID=A0A518AQ92_9BACT|nr:phytanoyl-CoA dioxygenase family protein [Aeoliella mucimassa]QDU56888.1 1-deoxypentalenic acid 11-beta-hydroxylase [Aeoliella mucimassa]
MSDKLRQAFAEDGYLLLQDFLSPEELSLLQQNLARYISDVVPTLPPSEAFYQIPGQQDSLRQLQRMDRDSFFKDYCSHPRWMELATTLLGEPMLPGKPEWFNKLPGGHATPPHQDNYYFQLDPPQVLTMWLALDDIDQENGGLRYVPGSHRKGRRPHHTTEVVGFSQGIADYSPDDSSKEELVIMRPGDLLVHHGETIHRADSNRSTSRQRRAFAMVFQAVSCQQNNAGRADHESNLARQHKKAGMATT